MKDRREIEKGWGTHFLTPTTSEYLSGTPENFPGRYRVPKLSIYDYGKPEYYRVLFELREYFVNKDGRKMGLSFDHGTFQMFNWIPGERNRAN